MQSLPRNVAALRRSQEQYGGSDVLWFTQAPQGNTFQENLSLCVVQCLGQSVSIKPGATTFTVILREPISRASDRVNPIIPAWQAA